MHQTVKTLVSLLCVVSSSCTTMTRNQPTYHAVMLSQLQVQEPCIASLVGAPSTSCVQWEPNVTAFARYEASRRLIFSGSGDSLLHVNDADNGRPLAKIETAGRVVTKAVFGANNAVVYFGTDKGKFYALDAYTFQPVFSLNVDGRVNNNILVVDDIIVFTTAVGTIYAIDAQTGVMVWHERQPLSKDRLRLTHQSNIIATSDEASGIKYIVVPHNDGYLCVMDVKTGKLHKRIELGLPQGNGFPDIVAPMVVVKNRLWVASHDLGVALIDLASFRIREQISLSGVLELATDGQGIFLATTDALFRLNENGKIMWKNDISRVKSRTPRAGFPFDKFSQGAKRLFFGVPTGMLVDDKHLVLSYSLGSLGIFDKADGRLVRSLGHSVGFSALEWASASSFVAISKRGLLMKFQS